MAFQKPSATGNTFAPVWGRGGERGGWDGVVSPAERTIFVLGRGGGSSSHETDGTAQIRARKCHETKEPLIPSTSAEFPTNTPESTSEFSHWNSLDLNRSSYDSPTHAHRRFEY